MRNAHRQNRRYRRHHCLFFVHIVEKGPDENVVRKMGPMSRRRAEKVARGANSNLNHDKYYVVVQDCRRKGEER